MPLSKVLRALSRHVNRGSFNVSYCSILPLFQRFHVSWKPRMSYRCTQQNAPNQHQPQLDFGAQASRTRSPMSTRKTSLGLDGLGNPHLRLCSRTSLAFHLTSKELNNCGGSNCFTSKCELVCSTGNLCIHAARTWSCSSNQYLQFAFVHTQPPSFEHL